MKLSLHPNDIRVRLVDMNVSRPNRHPSQCETSDTGLPDWTCYWDVMYSFFFGTLLQLIENLLFDIFFCCSVSDLFLTHKRQKIPESPSHFSGDTNSSVQQHHPREVTKLKLPSRLDLCILLLQYLTVHHQDICVQKIIHESVIFLFHNRT